MLCSRKFAGTDNDFSSLSPEKNRIISCVETPVETSPTRVIDFDTAQQQDCGPGTETSAKDQSKSVFRKLVAPEISSHRKSRHAIRVMPTLNEKSTDSSDCEDESQAFDMPDLVSPLLSIPHLPLTGKESRKSSQQRKRKNGKHHLDRVNELRSKALELTSTGHEAEALRVFDQAVRMNIAQIEKIKGAIAATDKKHPSTVDSIHLRLREDWLKIGLSIGEMRIRMTVLFERLGKYKLAISCCKEAVYTYLNHASISDTTSCGTNVKELAEKAEAMLNQLKIAQTTFEERAEKHKEIVALRGVIAECGDKALVERAESLALEVREIETQSLGENHPQVAHSCTLLTELTLQGDDLEKAVSYAEMAGRIYEASLGHRHPVTVEHLLYLARLCANAGKLPSSATSYSRALQVLRSLGDPQWVLVTVLNELSFVHIQQKQFDDAVACLREAVAVFESKKFGHSPRELGAERTSEVILVRRNLGHCYYELARFTDSTREFAGALELQKSFRETHASLSKSKSSKSAPLPFLASNIGLAETLQRLGRAYVGDKRFEEASAALKETVLIYRLDVAATLARAKGKIGSTLAEREDQLASALFCYAEARFEGGYYDDASKHFEESLEIRLFSDAHKEGNRGNMIHCSMCLAGLGNCHLKKKEYAESLRVFSDALEFCVGHGIPEHHQIHLMIKKKIRSTQAMVANEIGST